MQWCAPGPAGRRLWCVCSCAGGVGRGARTGYAFWKDAQQFETTDDAEVDGQIYAISPRVSGHVTEVLVEDEQLVKAGDVLVRLDPKDYEVAVEKAKADLADAVAALTAPARTCRSRRPPPSARWPGRNRRRADASAAVSGAQQQLGAAQARLATAQANVRVARSELRQSGGRMSQRYKHAGGQG